MFKQGDRSSLDEKNGYFLEKIYGKYRIGFVLKFENASL